MAGLLGKALAGAAAGGQEGVRVGFQDYLMRERDELERRRQETLMQFNAGENAKARELTQQQITESKRSNEAREGLLGRQAIESERSNRATEGDRAEQRKLQEKQVNAAVQQATIAAQKGHLELESLRRVKSLQDAYIKAPPAEKDALADQLYTVLGKDKFSPVTGKDEMGNPVFMGAFNTRSGTLVNPSQKVEKKEGRPDLSSFDKRATVPPSKAVTTKASQPQDASARMVAGMSEAALRQAAAKNDEIGRAARARLAEIEQQRAESAAASESAAQFPYPQ